MFIFGNDNAICNLFFFFNMQFNIMYEDYLIIKKIDIVIIIFLNCLFLKTIIIIC